MIRFINKLMLEILIQILILFEDNKTSILYTKNVESQV